MTVSPAAHSIGTMPARTAAPQAARARPSRSTLTRRRAVDYCRVATALCPAGDGTSQPAAPQSRRAA
jgi:hypothetical protein